MAKRKQRRSKATRRKASPAKAQATVRALEQYLRKYGESLLTDPNLTSVGVGYKVYEQEQLRTKELCIQFTVKSKAPPTELEALGTDPIPERIQVGALSVPTDVLERTYRPSYRTAEAAPKGFRKSRQDTLVPGISVSHPSGTAGTLGLIVYERATGEACMLSNWHVLNTAEGEPGDPIVQPGPFDDDRVDENKAGVLLRSHLGLAGDCAIARVEGRMVSPEIYELATAPRTLAEPELGERVVKSGRTTSVTRGIVSRTAVVTKLYYEGVGVRSISGFEYGPEDPSKGDEVSMGGDSGSAVLVCDKNGKPKDVLVGLHFAGEGRDDPREYALACYATNVFEKLEIELVPATTSGEATVTGYAPSFLGPKVPLPLLSSAQQKDAFVLDGARVLHYTHFSVVQSKSRRMARVVGWNIDGFRMKAYSRKGLDFVLDKRVGKFQIGNEAYTGNKLDRGHLARRADLVWGSPEEAQQANRDSFYYTNITPQHEAFNQSDKHGLWGRVENAILEQTDVQDLRVSVLAGPVFQESDLTYRKIRVPSDYWKLVAYVDAADLALHVKAYLLTQQDLLGDLEALDLDEFHLWQISVPELEQRTGLDFQDLGAHDDFTADGAPERVAPRPRRPRGREVRSEAELLG